MRCHRMLAGQKHKVREPLFKKRLVQSTSFAIRIIERDSVLNFTGQNQLLFFIPQQQPCGAFNVPLLCLL